MMKTFVILFGVVVLITIILIILALTEFLEEAIFLAIRGVE